VSSCLVEATGLTFKDCDTIVKVSANLRHTCSCNHAPAIRKHCSDRVHRAAVDQKAEKMKVCPGNPL